MNKMTVQFFIISILLLVDFIDKDMTNEKVLAITKTVDNERIYDHLKLQLKTEEKRKTELSV